MDFLAGLSPEGTWDGALYCHGNGNGTNGSYSHDRSRVHSNELW